MTADILILFISIVLTLGAGIAFSRQGRSLSDYFSAGKRLGWLHTGASLFSAGVSGEFLLVLAAAGAGLGMAASHLLWAGAFCILLLGWIGAPVLRRSGAITLPALMEARYGRGVRIVLAALSLALSVATRLTLLLFAGGLLLHRVFGLDGVTSSVILVLTAGIYAIAGGLYAVVRTQLFQVALTLAGAVLLTLAGLKEAGGMAGVAAGLSGDFFTLFRPASDPVFPWTAVVTGVPVLAVWYWLTEQYTAQRILGGRSLSVMRKGAFLAAYLKMFSPLFLILPGMIAVVLFPEINGDNALVSLLTSHLLPAGVKGLVASALLAAVIASLASCFSSCAALITLDLFQPAGGEQCDHKLILMGRLSTTVLVVLGILWIPLVAGLDMSVFFTLLHVQACLGPAAASVFVIGFVWTGATGRGALTALTAGTALGAARLVLTGLRHRLQTESVLTGLADMNFLHFAGLLFAFTSVILIAVSLAMPGNRSVIPGDGMKERLSYIKFRRIDLLLLWGLVLILLVFFKVFT